MSIQKWKKFSRIAIIPLVFLVGCVTGRQTATNHSLLHVFLYSPLPGATPQDFENFEKATRGMVGQIPGLKNVWVGKLREPVPAENDTIRTYGVGMEFESPQALEGYASHPAHDEWSKTYVKVRNQGTTTLDIVQ